MFRRTPAGLIRWLGAPAAIALLLGVAAIPARAAIQVSEEPQISAGAEAAAQQEVLSTLGLKPNNAGIKNPGTDALLGGPNWDAIKFIDVAALTGFFNIPPDPMGAAGPTQNVDVVNTGIESWDKSGALQWRASLKTFVTSLVGGSPGTLGTDGFDAKVVYDHYAGRFVVCFLERKTTTPTASRIIVAVSKTSAPASATTADWYYYAINSQITITSATFADYPGLEVDEDAIYITTNQFRFSTGAYGGTRLWIVNKTPFYAGGPAVNSVSNPYSWAGSVATTTMPALVFGAGGAGPGIGTYLVAYSGLNDGLIEYLEITRVDDPLGGGGGPFFTGDFLPIGAIDNVSLALPKGPQLGSAIGVDTGDRRVYDAVWRNNNLWLTATTLPVAGPNTGQTTTHWWRLNTAAVTSSLSPAGLIALGDDGEAGAEDVALGAMTAWSGIAVNALDEMKLTYGVFAPTIFPSAGVDGRQPADPPGTLQPSVIVRPGLAPYVRTFTSGSTGRNRWGDFTGMSVDPADDRTFWGFNEYADLQGNPTTVGTTTEDGQWATYWASCGFACATLQCPPPTTVHRGDTIALPFCINNCGSLADTYTYEIINQNGWCGPVTGAVVVPAGATICNPLTCVVPADAPCGQVKPLTFVVRSSSGQVWTCETVLNVECAPPCITVVCPPQTSVTRGNAATLTFCINNCGQEPETITYVLNNTNGWCPPVTGTLTLAPGQTICVNDACLVPPDAECGLVKPVTFIATTASGVTDACETSILVDCTVPTRLFAVDAEGQDGGVMLNWTMADGLQYQGFQVYREEGNTGRIQVTNGMLTGGPTFSFFDAYTASQPVNYWLAEIELDGSTVWHGPIAVTGGTALPNAISFAPARPNPFGGTTSIAYALPRDTNVRLSVFDAAGHLVRTLVDGTVPAGTHTVTWNGADAGGRRAPVGIYLVVLNAGGEVHKQKVLLGR